MSSYWGSKQRKNIEVSSSEITTENSDDIVDGLKTLRLKYTQKSHNSSNKYQVNAKRKFETMVSLVICEIDILMISETKID